MAFSTWELIAEEGWLFDLFDEMYMEVDWQTAYANTFSSPSVWPHRFDWKWYEYLNPIEEVEC